MEIYNPDRFLILHDEIEGVVTDVLTHLMRNSMDHGIETTSQRKRLGKKVWGTISINISIDSEKNVSIEFYDDGIGLNLSRIFAKGLDKELVDMAMTKTELLELIFRPGFSTAEKTTMISGRGVGMDAVRHYVMGLGASFEMIPQIEVDETMLEKVKALKDDVYLPVVF